MEFKCVALAKLFASMSACVCIPGSDYSYLKYREVLTAIL